MSQSMVCLLRSDRSASQLKLKYKSIAIFFNKIVEMISDIFYDTQSPILLEDIL